MLELTNTEQALKFAGFITEALEYVDEWTPTDINKGGCGVFAAYLYDKLGELELPREIYACFFDEGVDIEEIKDNFKKFLKTGVTNDGGPQHVLVKSGDIWLDSNGIANHTALHSKEKISLTREQLQILNDKGTGWNRQYDRTCNEFIKNKLDEAFSKYATFKSGCLPMPKEGEVEVTERTVIQRRRNDPMRELFRGLM